MNPSLAYALFTKGIDTYDIAKGNGHTEAEVVDALMKYREMKRCSTASCVGSGGVSAALHTTQMKASEADAWIAAEYTGG